MAPFEGSCYFCNQINITVLHKQTSNVCYESLSIYYDGNSFLYAWLFPDLLFHIPDVWKEEYEQLYII